MIPQGRLSRPGKRLEIKPDPNHISTNTQSFGMAPSIRDFYPKLADVSKVVELVQHYFGENAHSTVVAKLEQVSASFTAIAPKHQGV